MRFCSSVFVKGVVPDVVKCLQEISAIAFENNGSLFRSVALQFWVEVSKTHAAILAGATNMNELGIIDPFFKGFDFSGFHTTIDISCSSPNFATSLLPLADSIAAAVSQHLKTVCLVMDEDGDQLIREYDSGVVTRMFDLPAQYLEGLYWQPNLRHESLLNPNSEQASPKE